MLSRLSKLKGDELSRSNWRKIYKEEAKEKVKELNRKGEAAKNEAEMRMFLQANFAARDVYNIIDKEIQKRK